MASNSQPLKASKAKQPTTLPNVSGKSRAAAPPAEPGPTVSCPRRKECPRGSAAPGRFCQGEPSAGRQKSRGSRSAEQRGGARAGPSEGRFRRAGQSRRLPPGCPFLPPFPRGEGVGEGRRPSPARGRRAAPPACLPADGRSTAGGRPSGPSRGPPGRAGTVGRRPQRSPTAAPSAGAPLAPGPAGGGARFLPARPERRARRSRARGRPTGSSFPAASARFPDPPPPQRPPPGAGGPEDPSPASGPAAATSGWRRRPVRATSLSGRGAPPATWDPRPAPAAPLGRPRDPAPLTRPRGDPLTRRAVSP
ncbi:basic salivary proline-rich protein 3-like [Candoia aspera]|uniref:basic salivary proline-rich protein 3-like n=1 Tax=Candoia aspera TaxID=51853 RepID=UPI002FD86794